MDDSNRNPAIDADELNVLEQRLAAWRPSADGLDRDRVLYEAGYAAGRAESRVVVWRLATAALTLISLGASGIAARERSVLVHERSERLKFEVANRETARPSMPSTASRGASDAVVAAEPFGPGSYFALTSRLTQGTGDLSSAVDEIAPAPRRPIPYGPEQPTSSKPLHPPDVARVLDL